MTQDAPDWAEFVFEELGTRMMGDGVHYPDYLRLRKRVSDWSEWFDGWSEIAEEYELQAAEALRGGYHVTAGELWFQASIMWQYAQFLWFHRPEEREEGQRRKVTAYRQGAPYLRPAAERIEIPFEDSILPGYLRLPDGAGQTPCVVLIGGLESTKEESYHFENMCLSRGIATFAFDGPGQGEYFFERPMVPDFERYVSAAVAELKDRARIDASRLAVLGRSLGGHYAVRAAALDTRFCAVVDWGGPYDLSDFAEMPPLTQRGFRYVTGVADDAEAERAARRMIDLAGVAPLLTVPLYVQHGGRDRVIPVSNARRIIADTPEAAKTVAISETAGHCGHDIYPSVRPAIADWLAERLGQPRAQRLPSTAQSGE